MINASKEFKEKLKKGANLVNYADVTLSDGTVLHLEPKDFMIGGCQIEDKTTDGKFGVGYAIGKTLSIKIANHNEQYSQYDFYNAIIILYVAMLMDDGTIEKIRKGKYYATVLQTPGDIIEISAVDDMYKLDRPYAAATGYPATLQTILSDCCLDCGIPMRFRQFDNYNFVVNQKPEGLTYRQVMSYACQVAGYNARIDNDGYMDLVWHNTKSVDGMILDGGDYEYKEEPFIDGGNFTDYNTDLIISGGLFTDDSPENIYRIKTINVHTDDVVITGARVIFEDTNALFGEEGYVITVKNNPFTQGREQEIANYLGARMVGMVIRPFTAQVLNNPLYEPFDVCRVFDRKGNSYLSIINSVSYTIGGYTTISCEAEDPIRNGSQYFSAAAQAVVEARRNTEKQLSNYDMAVQNLTNLMMNSFGVFKTEEVLDDGSTVFYLHNKPTLEESDTIWKMTADGFAVSTDGGQSWSAGMDSQGNAVVNVLSAIGIQFDWARGGTLTLGGFDNRDGIIHIMDKNNRQVGTIDNNGLYFYSDETGIQIVVSPLTGFVQRDADGNDFFGLLYNQIHRLPSLGRNIKNTSYYPFDSDDMKRTIDRSWTETNMGGFGISYYQISETFTHSSAGWNSSSYYLPSEGNTSMIVTLPSSFRGKSWAITDVSIDKSITYEVGNLEYTPLCQWSYNTGALPGKCYEGSKITYTIMQTMYPTFCPSRADIISLLDNTMTESQFLSKYSSISDLTVVRSVKNSPYIPSAPSQTSGSYDASGEVDTSLLEGDISYTKNETAGTITITGKARCGPWKTNELLAIRVRVVA